MAINIIFSVSLDAKRLKTLDCVRSVFMLELYKIIFN